MTILFGSILSISSSETIIIGAVAAAILLAMVIIARPLFFISLDPEVATAKGIPTRLISVGFMIIVAVTVAEAVQAVGALLVFALLLLPAAISQRITSRPYFGLILAAVIATIFTWSGITIGFYSGLPSSVCISLLSFIIYVIVVGPAAIWSGRSKEEVTVLTHKD